MAGPDTTSKPRGFATEHQPVVSRMPLALAVTRQSLARAQCPTSESSRTSSPSQVATLSFVQSDMARSSCRLGMHSCTQLASMLAVAFGPEQVCLPLPLTVG